MKTCICGQPKNPRDLLCREGWGSADTDDKVTYQRTQDRHVKRAAARRMTQHHQALARAADLDGTAAMARQREHVAATYTAPLSAGQPSPAGNPARPQA